MTKNRFLTLSTLFLFFLSAIFIFNYRQEKLKQNFVLNKVFDIGQSFVLSETDLNPEHYQNPTWPKLKRPNNIFGYLFEYLRDRKTISKNNYGPIYFASKRIVVLEQLQEESIIGKYQDFDQLIKWWERERPKNWQFWSAQKFDNWEASLAEIYLKMDQEIGLANLIADDAKRVERFCELRRALLIFDDKLSNKINDLTDSKERKNYLFSAKDEVFSRLAQKIADQVPPYDFSNHYYSLRFLSKESDGIYEISLINLGLNQGTASFRLGKNAKSFNVGKEKIISLGETNFGEGSPWAVLTLTLAGSFPADKAIIPTSAKIKLKKISSFVSKKPVEEKAENQIFNIKKYYLFLSIIAFIFSIYLGNKAFKYKKIFLKIFNAIGGFYSKRKILSILLYLGIIIFILIFAVNYFDLCLMVTVFFWMILSKEERLGSRYSLFISLGIVLLGPLLIFSKKEITTEMVSIAAFMFMVAGVIQQFVYLKKEPSGKINISKIYYKFGIRYLFVLVLPILIFLILKSIKGELTFYRYFFESNYLSEFIGRIFIKVLFLPVLLVLLTVIKVINKLFSESIKSSIDKVLLFSAFSLTLIMFVNKILFINEREKFALRPYITRINKTESDLEIYGHNFHDVPFVGKVYLDSMEVPVKEWKDWRITVKFEESFRREGKLYIVSQYDDYNDIWFTSNYYKMKTE